RRPEARAEALASLEYCLEALRDQRGHRDDILDIARSSLEALGYWPVPEPEPMPEPAPEAVAPPAQALPPPVATPSMESPAAPAFTGTPATQPPAALETPQPAAPVAPAPPPPVAPPPPAHAPAPVGTGTAGGFEVTGDEIDDEIREIFLEEFEEEIANLRDMLPEWREAP